MIFTNDNPIDELVRFLSKKGFKPKQPQSGEGVIFSPHAIQDFTQLFLEVTGQDVLDYLPSEFTDLAKGMLITGMPAIRQQDNSYGLSLIKEEDIWHLNFVVSWGSPFRIYDVVTIEESFIEFKITYSKSRRKKLIVAGDINSGKIKFHDYDLALSVGVKVPSFIIDARLGLGADSNKVTSGNLADDYLGSLKKTGATNIVIEDIRFKAASFVNNFSLYLSVANVLNIHNKLRVNQFQADINYRGSTGESDYSILAYTDLEIGFEKGPLAISLSAEMKKRGGTTRWKFTGSQHHPVSVDQIIQNLANLFKEGGTAAENPYHLPEFIANTKLNYLGLAFEVVSGKRESEQDYTFTFGLGLPIGEKEAKLEMYAHYHKKNLAYELELTGAIFLNGFQLAVGFAKKGNGKKSDTLILGNLQTPIKLDSQYLIRALSPNLADIVPINVELEIPDLLIAIHQATGTEAKDPNSQKDYLFRLSFKLDFNLGGIPLIGSMLEKLKFNNGQLLTANKDWKKESFDDLNGLMTKIKPKTPKPLLQPKQANATIGVSKGLSLSGTFQITDEIGLPLFDFPLFLNFGGETTKQQNNNSGSSTGGSTPNSAGDANNNTKQPNSAQTGKPDQRSQSKIDKTFGAVSIKKVALVFQEGRLGLKITGGLSLVAFEFELMGLQVTVPQSVLSNPADIKDISFNLDGFGANIRKGPLSITGAFLKQHHADGTDEYSGLVQVQMTKLGLTGLGSYAKFKDEKGEEHSSLFLFVALSFPIPVHPSLLITGMSLGFGIHRDAIMPKLKDVLGYPLVKMAVTPPPKLEIGDMLSSMNQYFPTALDQYFVVAGIKFKAFSLVETSAMLLIKFGRSFEINIIGVSSVRYPSLFIELAWTARFVPDTGYLFIGGELTNSSHILIPKARLTGGFAAATWTKGPHAGDFVVSVGGYHPKFAVPSHYPNHIPRLGISFHLGSLTIKGAVYFAVTPRYLMMGGFLEASINEGRIEAYLKIQMDAIINFEPFHYDLMVGVDAGIKFTIGWGILSESFDLHLHFDCHLWGPDFSGKASVDVGPRTFEMEFGESRSIRAVPISWNAFKKKFLESTGKTNQKKYENSKVVIASVTKGLVQKVKENGGETYVVDPNQFEIEIKSLIPIVDSKTNSDLGIAPMDIKGGVFTSILTVNNVDDFTREDTSDSFPTGIWGKQGLSQTNTLSGGKMLVENVKTGIRLTAPPDKETGESAEISKANLAYNTDEFELLDKISTLKMTGKAKINADGELEANDFRTKPGYSFSSFTGLDQGDLVSIEAGHLLHESLLECEFA